jgi:hypothetical protein
MLARKMTEKNRGGNIMAKNEVVEVIPESVQDIFKWLPKSDFHSREKAFVYHSSRGVESYIIMGAILCKKRDDKDWETAECRTMREYCEGVERISYTQAFRMMTIWDKLSPYMLEHYDVIKNISFVNLYEVARIASLDVLSELKLVELMDQAAVDTERGFKDNIREIEKKKPPTDKCDHLTAEKWFYKCRSCDKLVGVDWADIKKRVIAEGVLDDKK